MTEKQQVWFGGVPVDIELKRLAEKYPQPKVGDEFWDDDLEDVIGCSKKTFRFKTVISRWRKNLRRDYDYYLKRLKLEGYRVMDDIEKNDHASGIIKGIGRRVKTVEHIVETTDRNKLDDAHKPIYDKQTIFVSRVNEAKRLGRKEFKNNYLPGAVGKSDR